MAIKGGGGQHERGIQKKPKKELERESKKSFHLYSSFRTLICTSGTRFPFKKSLNSVIVASNHLFNISIVNFYPSYIIN